MGENMKDKIIIILIVSMFLLTGFSINLTAKSINNKDLKEKIDSLDSEGPLSIRVNVVKKDNREYEISVHIKNNLDEKIIAATAIDFYGPLGWFEIRKKDCRTVYKGGIFLPEGEYTALGPNEEKLMIKSTWIGENNQNILIPFVSPGEYEVVGVLDKYLYFLKDWDYSNRHFYYHYTYSEPFLINFPKTKPIDIPVLNIFEKIFSKYPLLQQFINI